MFVYPRWSIMASDHDTPLMFDISPYVNSITFESGADELYLSQYYVSQKWTPTTEIKTKEGMLKVHFASKAFRLEHCLQTMQIRVSFSTDVGGVISEVIDEEMLYHFSKNEVKNILHSALKKLTHQYADAIISKYGHFSVGEPYTPPKFSEIAASMPKAQVLATWSVTAEVGGKSHQPLQSDLKKILVTDDAKSIYLVAQECPVSGPKCSKQSVYAMIQHLNDTHHWDRATQIADWLDTLHDAGIIDITIKSNDPDKA
jgi:hypothetical protein